MIGPQYICPMSARCCNDPHRGSPAYRRVLWSVLAINAAMFLVEIGAGLAVPSENLIRWIRSRKENRIMIETDGDLLQTSARIYVGLLSFA